MGWRDYREEKPKKVEPLRVMIQFTLRELVVLHKVEQLAQAVPEVYANRKSKMRKAGITAHQKILAGVQHLREVKKTNEWLEWSRKVTVLTSSVKGSKKKTREKRQGSL